LGMQRWIRGGEKMIGVLGNKIVWVVRSGGRMWRSPHCTHLSGSITDEDIKLSVIVAVDTFLPPHVHCTNRLPACPPEGGRGKERKES
jgi:hypothetical protein